MDDAPPCFAENVLAALIIQMIRSGALAEDDLLAAADTLDDDESAFLQALIVEAAAPPLSEWKADRARSRFRVIEGGE